MANVSKDVSMLIDRYFEDLSDGRMVNIYQQVMATTERCLLQSMMRLVSGNQSKAAQRLGISRNTLRAKLKQHHLIDAV